jgi:hypothetical protein
MKKSIRLAKKEARRMEGVHVEGAIRRLCRKTPPEPAPAPTPA